MLRLRMSFPTLTREKIESFTHRRGFRHYFGLIFTHLKACQKRSIFPVMRDSHEIH